jgi:hypothetical protein
VNFLEALDEYGFVLTQNRPGRGSQAYAARPNDYLTQWVHLYEDGTALFTWEFAVTDYLWERGIQLGSSESLNLFMFPREDERGPQDAAWLVSAMDRAEAQLRSVDFANPIGKRPPAARP